MPLFNSRLDVLFGTDRYTGVLPRDGTPYLLADDTTRAGWVHDDAVVLQAEARRAGGKPHVEVRDLTGKLLHASTADGSVVGGGGRWAAFLQTSPSRIYDSHGPLILEGGHPSVGADGTLVYVTNYQSGRGLTMVSRA